MRDKSDEALDEVPIELTSTREGSGISATVKVSVGALSSGGLSPSANVMNSFSNVWSKRARPRSPWASRSGSTVHSPSAPRTIGCRKPLRRDSTTNASLARTSTWASSG